MIVVDTHALVGLSPTHPSSVRKLRRCAPLGWRGGESAEVRIIYYYLDERLPLYALLAYAKADQADLKPSEIRAVSALASALKATAKETK